MYGSTSSEGDRVCAAYFTGSVTTEQVTAFLRDLLRWAEDGPYRLQLIVDDVVDRLSHGDQERLVRALVTPPITDAIDRVAVTGDPSVRPLVDALDDALPVSVFHFGTDWHRAQEWLRAPIGA